MATKLLEWLTHSRGEHNNVKFHIFCLKEADYVAMMMLTFGSELPVGKVGEISSSIASKNSGDATQITFELTEPFHLYYKYRGVVDAHNTRQHSSILLEETWVTKSWEHHMFALVLAVSETNIFGGNKQIWGCFFYRIPTIAAQVGQSAHQQQA